MRRVKAQHVTISGAETGPDMREACQPVCDSTVYVCTGYLFNIQFLRRVFNPTFTLHDLRQTGPHDITTRWTMRMEFALTRSAPASPLHHASNGS